MISARKGPRVSVIIAARNAAGTLASTFQTLCSQTYADWEAILINDGSTDDTLTLASDLAQSEPRLRVLSQSALGLSSARNHAIEAALGDWILFLDADDTIAERHLEMLTGVIDSYPHLGGVHCGWDRLRDGEKLFGNEFCPHVGDLFQILAVRPAFVIHSCVIRREAVIAAGMFDPSLTCCADWDLWQRIARMGTQFGAVREVLAHYMISSKSSSSRSLQMLDDGLTVIRRGHAADPRLMQPLPKHADGRPEEGLFACEAHMVCWSAAGLVMERRDPMPALNRLPAGHRLSPAAYSIATAMLDAFLLRANGPVKSLLDTWSTIVNPTRLFLQAAEARLQSSGFASSVEAALVSLLLNRAPPTCKMDLGKTMAVKVEASHEIQTLQLSSTCERVHCTVEWRGSRLGAIELPILVGRVPAYVLRDAIAAQFFWPLLGAFFQESLYSEIELRCDDGIVSAWRNGRKLDAWSSNSKNPRAELHDYSGWTLFLQELWGKPDWDPQRFYREEAPAPSKSAGRTLGLSRIEIGGPLPSATPSGRRVTVTLAGIPLGMLRLSCDTIIPPDGWIPKITAWAGLELCRIAVRELVIGWSSGPSTLRARLDVLAGRRSAGVRSSATRILLEEGIQKPISLLGRRNATEIDSSDSRRAVLPAKAGKILARLARLHGESTYIGAGAIFRKPSLVVYSPELHPARLRLSLLRSPHPQSSPAGGQQSMRLDFEALYARSEDPWGYTNEFEQTKYRHTASLLAGRKFEGALELACAEGCFTTLLAALVGHLEATDFSEIALSRARSRCSNLTNVSFSRLDLAKDPFPGRFDLIVCSECLYYLPDRGSLEHFAKRVSQALTEGGCFLTAHANVVADGPDQPGRDWNVPFGAKTIEEVFLATSGFQLLSQILTPLYRVQLFCRSSVVEKVPPVQTRMAEMGELPPKVSTRVKWHGGRPSNDRPQPGTERLPILMFHRIAPLNGSIRRRYCIEPRVFEKQMQFLHEAGAYTTTLGQWQEARGKRRPLPGKAILLTFDDGYQDFAEFAWPVLQQFGFSALVFLVTGKIGGTSDWTQEPAPLLGWDAIQKLHRQGVEFGSHTHTHRSLLTLAFDELVTECAESRLVLEKKLGVPAHSFSYPYGETDRISQHFVAACGYRFATGVRAELSGFTDPALDLARIEISGHYDLEDFVRNLCASSV